MRCEIVRFRTLARLLAVVALLDAGCRHGGAADGNDPIAALRARKLTTRYDHVYWIDQARRGTAIWDSAFALCSPYWRQNDGSMPNCGLVYTAYFQHSGANTPIRRGTARVESLAPRP